MLGRQPNITGSASRSADQGLVVNGVDCQGPFYAATTFSYGTGLGPMTGTTVRLGFDASRGSPTYGRVATVQPAALHALACIKS